MAAGGGVLARLVYVGFDIWPAGSTPPPDVAAQITNPHAWVGGVCPISKEPEPDVVAVAVAESTDCATTVQAPMFSHAATPEVLPAEPSRSGRGATAAAWSAYADALHIPVPAGAKRDDIIAAVDAANGR